MPHQDTDQVTANAQDLQEALEWLLPEGTFSDITFRNQSVWNPMTLIFTALMWCWSGKSTLTKRFAEARKIVARNAPDEEQPGNSYTGFLKRLAHWSMKLKERVVAEFRRTMQEELIAHYLVGGWLVLAGDGSRTATSRTQSNEARFAAKKKPKRKAKKPTAHQKRLQKAKKRKQKKQTAESREKKGSTPQIWLTVLYHVGLGLPWDWRRGPSDSSERRHLLEMAKGLPENSLITMDAGFVGYDFWQELNQAGVAFVARVGSNVRLLKNLGYVRSERDIVYVWPDKARKEQQAPLVLRLHAFSGAKEEVYLVTNVLEKNRLSTSQMRDIYQARWGVELVFKRWKSLMDLDKSRDRTNGFRQLTELYAKLLGCLVTHWTGLLRAGLLTKLSWHRILKRAKRAIGSLSERWDAGHPQQSVMAVLRKLVKRLNRLKPRSKRKKKPGTMELLDNPEFVF